MNYRISLSTSDKIALIGNLSTMLTAGIPILEAVDSVKEDTKGHTQQILQTLKTDLMQGKHLYESFSAFPNAFDSVTISLLKASEEAGTLETTLNDLRVNIEKEAEFIDKVKLAMIYPGLIGCVFFLVLFVILTFVIPRIAMVFSRMNVVLPLPTKVLIFLSDIVVKHTLPLIGGIVLLIGSFWLLNRRYHSAIMHLIFSLPVVSQLIRSIDLTRFSRTMHLLLSSGIPIDKALLLSQAVVIRASTKAVISKSRDMIMAGKKLTDGLRAVPGAVPSIFIKLVEAGEKSGTLDQSMQDISTHLDYQVSNDLKTLTSVMEPVMLLVVGLFVGGMMLSIISPIYSLIGQVGPR